jgi:hypothetical protein
MSQQKYFFKKIFLLKTSNGVKEKPRVEKEFKAEDKK